MGLIFNPAEEGKAATAGGTKKKAEEDGSFQQEAPAMDAAAANRVGTDAAATAEPDDTEVPYEDAPDDYDSEDEDPATTFARIIAQWPEARFPGLTYRVRDYSVVNEDEPGAGGAVAGSAAESAQEK
jgi:hypothetical protein